MADTTTAPARGGGARVRTVRSPSLLRWPLRIAVIVYLALLVVWPVVIVGVKTFERGLSPSSRRCPSPRCSSPSS